LFHSAALTRESNADPQPRASHELHENARAAGDAEGVSPSFRREGRLRRD
jgi:hypothetical protein